MTETVEVKINLSSDHWDDRYPGARVYINNNLIFEGLISQPEEINWHGELEEGEQDIVIEMYNKQDGDTVQDESDNILKDVVLNIDNIEIDEIELEQLLWINSEYTSSAGKITECVNLGWNGFWKLSFSVPTYLWFLENL